MCPVWWVRMHISLLNMNPVWWVRVHISVLNMSPVWWFRVHIPVLSMWLHIWGAVHSSLLKWVAMIFKYVFMNIAVIPFEECAAVVAYVNVSHSSLHEQCIITYEKQM